MNEPSIADLTFSIVVCSRGRPAELVADCLSAIRKMVDCENLQLILVDNNDDQGLKTVANAHGAVYLHETTPGISVARNVGIAASRGEFILFTDDDCIVDPCWASLILRDLARDRDLACVGGVAVTPSDSTLFQKSIGLLRGDLKESSRRGLQAASRLDSANIGYRARVLAESGGFDTNLSRSVEFELNLRLFKAGHRMLFDPDIRVMHRRRETFRQFLRQFFNWGLSNFMICTRYPTLFIRTRQFLAPIVMLWMVTAVVAFFLINLAAPLVSFLLLISAYSLNVSIRVIRFDREKIRYLPLALAALFLRTLAEAVGFYTGVLESLDNLVRR